MVCQELIVASFSFFSSFLSFLDFLHTVAWAKNSLWACPHLSVCRVFCARQATCMIMGPWLRYLWGLYPGGNPKVIPPRLVPSGIFYLTTCPVVHLFLVLATWPEHPCVVIILVATAVHEWNKGIVGTHCSAEMVLDHIIATVTCVMWHWEHVRNVSVLQSARLYKLISCLPPSLPCVLHFFVSAGNNNNRQTKLTFLCLLTSLMLLTGPQMGDISNKNYHLDFQ